MKEIQITCLCRGIRLADVGVQLAQGQVHYLPLSARNSPEVANAQRVGAIKVEVVERFKERRDRQPEKAKPSPRPAPPPFPVMNPPAGKNPTHPQTVIVKEYKTDINPDRIAQSVRGSVTPAVVKEVRATLNRDLRLMVDVLAEDLTGKVGELQADLTTKVGAVQEGLTQKVTEIQDGLTLKVEEGLTGVRAGMAEDVKLLLEKMPRVVGTAAASGIDADTPAFIPDKLMNEEMTADLSPTEASTQESSVDEATAALRAAKAKAKATAPKAAAPKTRKRAAPKKKKAAGKEKA